MKHSDHLEYFLQLKNTFSKSSELTEKNKESDTEFEKVFLDNLLTCVISVWNQYELSNRDSYLLTEDELEKVWKNSKDELLNETIIKLSELNYIKTAVNENGEIVYSISELGRQYLNHL